jgi:ABC-2 type transport system permease protein
MSRSPWQIIAHREFLERVRTKWFLIVTLLGPIGLIGIIVVPAYLGMKAAEKGVEVQIIDRSGQGVGENVDLWSKIQGSSYRFEMVDPGTDEAVLLGRVASGAIDGFLVLPADIVSGGKAVYRGDNAASFAARTELTQLLSAAVIMIRLDIDVKGAMTSLRPVEVNMVGSAGASGEGMFIAGYVVMFLLYMAIILYAMNVMRGVILEKTSKVVEIVISATKPRSLMLGKIVGVGGVGLAQLGLWAIVALILIEYRGPVLDLFGVSGSSFSVPPLSAADFAVVLIYFVLGFLLYAALYAAVGALVSSEQEASQLQMPIVLLLVIPVMCVGVVTGDPRGSITSALTLFPFSSPVLMPMRYLLDGVGTGELLLSLVLLVATIIGTVWLAAKIYRLGILLTGKRPSLREVVRWLRHD